MEIEIIVSRIIIVDGKEYTIRVPAGPEVDEEEFANKIRENKKKAEAEGLTKIKKDK